MKIKFNGKEVSELTQIQKKVIKNDIPSEIFDNDMTRRCKYWIEIPCEKDAEGNQEIYKEKLNSKGRTTIPISSLKLAVLHAEEFPCRFGYEDIVPKSCSIGDQNFEFSADHQKIWRKINEKLQDNLSKEEYIELENKMMAERMGWILNHKYERCFERLKKAWIPKLANRGILSIPSDDDQLAQLIFSQEDYRDRSQRMAEGK